MKHAGPNFDSAYRNASSIRPVPVKECDEFIKAHYLERRPAIVHLCLVAEFTGPEAFGCVVYSAPPAEARKRYHRRGVVKTDKSVIWELARLYLLDWVPRNAETWLIGRSIRHIKQHHPDVECLVSYADLERRNHTGAIYRASNWTADGYTDDDRKKPRNDIFDTLTNKVITRWGEREGDDKPSWDPGRRYRFLPRTRKHRFFYKLK